MINEIINGYKKYISIKGWTQREAAEAVNCSTPHMNRILNGKCVPSAALASKIEHIIKNSENDINFCKKKFPLGDYFIALIDTFDNIKDKQQELIIIPDWQMEVQRFLIKAEKDEDIFNSNYNDDESFGFFFYSPTQKTYFFQEICIYEISGYYTEDGYNFFPYYQDKHDKIFYNYPELKKATMNNVFDTTTTLLKKDFSNLKNFINNLLINFNKQHNTDYIPIYTVKEAKQALQIK